MVAYELFRFGSRAVGRELRAKGGEFMTHRGDAEDGENTKNGALVVSGARSA